MPYGRYYNSVAENRQVFYGYGFGDILSSVPQNRLAEIILGLEMKGNQSRTTDFAELKQDYRTTYEYFLEHGKWNEQKVSQKQQEKSFEQVAQLAQEKQTPLYLSIDDTVIEKKKPFSQTKWPMERVQTGIIPIWQASRYLGIRCSARISASEMFLCVIACAAAVRKVDPKSKWLSNFWKLCRRQAPRSSFRRTAGTPATSCGTRRWKRILH